MKKTLFCLTVTLLIPIMGFSQSRITNVEIDTQGSWVCTIQIEGNGTVKLNEFGDLDDSGLNGPRNYYGRGTVYQGKVARVGNTNIDYYGIGTVYQGKVARIGNTNIDYYGTGTVYQGKVARIGNTNIDYYGRGTIYQGKIARIENVKFDYYGIGTVYQGKIARILNNDYSYDSGAGKLRKGNTSFNYKDVSFNIIDK